MLVRLFNHSTRNLDGHLGSMLEPWQEGIGRVVLGGGKVSEGVAGGDEELVRDSGGVAEDDAEA